MPDDKENDSINAQPGKVPRVGPHPGGPKPKAFYKTPVMETINLTAPRAAILLQLYIERKRGFTTMSRDLIEACKYIIDHTIGKARQKVELSGGVMSYGELVKSADELDKKPRPVLADALDIAHKYQESNPVEGDKPGD